MEAITPTLIVVGIVNLITFPLLLWLIKRFLGRKFDRMDENREHENSARMDAERKSIEQREAERSLILAMSRSMLLNNFERCMEKGYYTVEEREVYHALFEAYEKDGGNSVIADIAPRIRELPYEPPRQ